MTDTDMSVTYHTAFDCPACEKVADGRYLGDSPAADHDGFIVGWECLECGAELQEDVGLDGKSFDLREVNPEIKDGGRDV